MVLPLVPILVMGAVRLAAPAVAKFLIKKGFKKASQKALTKAGNNAKSISKPQASKLTAPTKITPKTTKVKPKAKLTKEQMVRTISDKPRPRLPKDQIPKPPSNKVPAVRTSSPKASSPTKEYLKKQGFKKSSGNVPANRTGSSVTAPKKMKLGGLKKKVRLRDTIVPLTVGTIAASQLGGGPKSGESKTVGKKKRKSVLGGRGTINEKPGQRDKATIDFTVGDKIRKDRKIPKGALDASGDVKAMPKIHPAVRAYIKKAGNGNFNKGLKTFESTGIGKSIEKGLASLGGGRMRTALESASDSAATEFLNENLKDMPELNDSQRDYIGKRKGGKVSKKKGGMVKRSYGGKVKRNMGGMVSPRKKVVFRRGGGRALRGMGKAIYSNKMY